MPSSEALSSRRGRGPHHAQKDRVGSWEIPRLTTGHVPTGPHREGEEPEPMMHGRGKSDSAIVASRKGKEKFTSLLHHISIALLAEAFSELKEDAAPGIDGLTWWDYGLNLERNLEDLHARIHRGAYQALPSRLVYILKPYGRQRPLAVAALEDKIVQRATAAVFNAMYEEDFLGFSYGFRPGRGTHDAQDALRSPAFPLAARRLRLWALLIRICSMRSVSIPAWPVVRPRTCHQLSPPCAGAGIQRGEVSFA
jgi:hypothetical protein